MFFNKKLSERDIKHLKENASYLNQFTNNMFSARNQLKEKRDTSFNENTFINELCQFSNKGNNEKNKKFY